MWDDYLDCIPSGDSLAASYALSLPPAAGGQADAPWDFLVDAANWAVSNVFGTVGATISDALTEIGRLVVGGVSAVLGWVLRHLYRILRSWLLPFVDPAYAPNFFDPDVAAQLPPSTYFIMIFDLVFRAVEYQFRRLISWTMNWIRRVPIDQVGNVLGLFGWLRERVGDARDFLAGKVTDAASWLWSTVKAGLGYAARGFVDLVSAIWGKVTDAASWLKDRVWGFLGLAGTGFSTLAAFIGSKISDAASWLWGLIQSAISGIRSAGSTLYNLVTSAASDAASWLWGQIQSALAGLGSLGGNLWDIVSTAASDAASWLWDQIRPMLEQILSSLAAGAQAILELAWDGLIQPLLQVFNRLLEPVADTLAAKLAIPARALAGEFPTFQSFLAALMDPPRNILQGIGLFAWAFIIGLESLFVSFFPAFRPVNEKWAQEISRNIRETIPSLRDLIDMRRRGEISAGEFRDALERMGLPDWAIGGYFALLERIPPPADLIRFGVREVFTPEIRQRFGLDQDFPEDFARFMELQGFPSQWSQAYWAAHWELPSVQQGFEMFHRGVISLEDLRTLLRAQDIMPFFRDKLTDIAYNVITRVDVRRMYQVGVIDEDKVYRTYLDLGYRPEDARALTDWVKTDYSPAGEEGGPSARDLTLSVIKRAYARRLIDRTEALDRLRDLRFSPADAELILSIWDFDFFTDPDQRSEVRPKALSRSLIERAYERGLIDFNRAAGELEDLGYTPEDASLILELVDLRQAEELTDLETDAVVQRFRAGLISDAQLAAELQALNVPQGRIDLILQREILRRQVKGRTLSISQLQRAFRQGVIDEAFFRQRLDAMGYNETDINILVAIT